MGRLMCGSLLPRPRASLKIRESDTLGLPGEGKLGDKHAYMYHTHKIRHKYMVGCDQLNKKQKQIMIESKFADKIKKQNKKKNR